MIQSSLASRFGCIFAPFSLVPCSARTYRGRAREGERPIDPVVIFFAGLVAGAALQAVSGRAIRLLLFADDPVADEAIGFDSPGQ